MRASLLWKLAFHAAAFGLLLLVLWRAAPFLKLGAVSLVLAAALESPVRALVDRGWRRALAVAATCALSVAVAAGALVVIVPRIAPEVQQAAASAPELLSRVQSSPEYHWLNRHDLFDRAVDEARSHAAAALGSLAAAAVGVLSFAAGVLTVVAVTVFLLLSGPATWRWLLRWVDPSRRARVRRVAASARRAVAGYVAGALIMGAVAGTVTAVTTGLLGVPFFLALAVLTAGLGIVPFIGALVTGILVVAATLVTVGPTAALTALAVFVVYQQLEGAVLQPLVQRYTTSMNALVVLVSVLLGTSAAGIFGGVVALPIAAAAKVVANDALAHRRKRWTSSERRTEAGGAEREPPPSRH